MKPIMILALFAMLSLPSGTQAQVLGNDAAACSGGSGPAILANVTGFKDRKGGLKLELYPATEADFLKDDRNLLAEGKTFRRIRAAMPASGAVSMCIRVPRPGTYALLFTHDRDGKNKFNFWSDGAGVPSNIKLGRARPKLAGATITVGAGVSVATMRVQYLRGFPPSFGPVGKQ